MLIFLKFVIFMCLDLLNKQSFSGSIPKLSFSDASHFIINSFMFQLGVQCLAHCQPIFAVVSVIDFFGGRDGGVISPVKDIPDLTMLQTGMSILPPLIIFRILEYTDFRYIHLYRKRWDWTNYRKNFLKTSWFVFCLCLPLALIAANFFILNLLLCVYILITLKDMKYNWTDKESRNQVLFM